MLFSFIIPTYNSVKYIQRCLDSILVQGFLKKEIIVIDNGSNDSTPELVVKEYPQVKIIKNRKNRGSSFARNQGIDISAGEYIVFMDSDTYLNNNFIASLVRHLRQLEFDIAGISPKILMADSEKIFSCGLQITPSYRVYDIGRGKKSRDFSKPFIIDGINTCCSIFKREVLEDIKEQNMYFDERFFFLFEDVDLSIRLKDKGYRFLFSPDLVCYHHGFSSGIKNDYRRYLCFRNRWYIILKNKKDIKSLLSFMSKSFFYDLIRTSHFAITNPYCKRAFKEILERMENAKEDSYI